LSIWVGGGRQGPYLGEHLAENLKETTADGRGWTRMNADERRWHVVKRNDA
jgi:hypothetical protein